MQSRIMYIEHKGDGLSGAARIGCVSFSKSGRTLYYCEKTFQSLKGAGFKANYCDVENGDEYWISGCTRDGGDRLYGERVSVDIDDDVRHEYWIDIRKQRENKAKPLPTEVMNRRLGQSPKPLACSVDVPAPSRV